MQILDYYKYLKICKQYLNSSPEDTSQFTTVAGLALKLNIILMLTNL